MPTSPSLIASYEPSAPFEELVTLVMPTFNQAGRIIEVLDSLIESSTLPARLIVIDDASEDGTDSQLRLHAQTLRKNAPPELKVEYYRYKQSQFETRCDAFGFGLAKTRYVIEVQADMKLEDSGFDARLVSHMHSNPDLLMLSGRGVEPLLPIAARYRNTLGADVASGISLPRYLLGRLWTVCRRFITPNAHKQILGTPPLDHAADIFPTESKFETTKSAGRLAEAINLPLPANFPRDKIWLGETVMRGPLIIDLSKYFVLGGFNVKRFFLGYDEHELALLGYLQHGYRVGFHPVQFSAPTEFGSTRRIRSIKSEFQIARNLFRILRSRKSSPIFQLKSSSAELPVSHIRKMSAG